MITGTYYIHGQPVNPFVIMQPAPYTANVVDFEGKQYNVICNGWGDMWILIDGKKRYLETK